MVGCRRSVWLFPILSVGMGTSSTVCVLWDNDDDDVVKIEKQE